MRNTIMDYIMLVLSGDGVFGKRLIKYHPPKGDRLNHVFSVIARSPSWEGRRGDLGGGALGLPRPSAEGLAMTPVTIQ